MKVNRIVKILMQRDNLSYSEAQNVFDDVKEEINEILSDDPGNFTDVEDILLSDLGLEMDYIFDILY